MARDRVRRLSGGGGGEFGIIARHFAPLAGPGGLGLLDDAATLTPPSGRDLVLTADAIVAGVHFLPGDPPDLVARKLLRVNLSDLAAKGAVPLGYLMTVSVPRGTPEVWFASFARGLALDQAAFGIALLGGDTTSTPGPVSLSLTAIGHVAHGGMVRRAGARAGDALYVTGTIGAGALGLLAATGRLPDPAGRWLTRYRLPEPRFMAMDGVHAAMDVSDGLIQDAGHLARASGLALRIDADAVPVADRAQWETCVTGGDDYEILLAAAPEAEPALRAAAGEVPLTRIGVCAAGEGVTVTRDGIAVRVGGGWDHLR